MFNKVLIANRGAIAVRIERTLKKMGVKSAAVFTKADRDSLHVENACETVYLGEGNVKATYLDAERVLDAAVKVRADAIHPGYGFLSENAGFARACAARGIKFIGPLPEQVEMFGLKHRARELAVKANVPLLPGSGLLHTLDEAVLAAEKTGYPVMLKSTAGGGGIGIRVCRSPEELKDVYEKVRRLAGSNFGDDGVFVEKYIERARHIEVQIFGNEYGEAIAVGERDCSVQRRNQKVIEEAPAPGISEQLRQEMMGAAERLAKSVGYRSAGTVEFLYDDINSAFYFLEVNTRLQVEHGITEEVCGIDLVEWMILEAAGELKNLAAPKQSGHSFEARIYAEDCLNDFRPGTGKIDDAVFAKGVRVENWIRKNMEITSLYDPMLAKLIVRGETREDALQKLRAALKDTKIYGVPTNLNYLLKLTEQEQYSNGRIYTKMLDTFQPEEPAIEVLNGGLQTTVQDYPGMIGYWTVGVPPCGAFDSYSFRIGNRLLGNDEGAPGLEMTMRGGSYKFRTAASFCLTGADMGASLDGEKVAAYAVIQAKAGQTLTLNESKAGMRTYLLVAGGIQVPKVMGSGSTFIDGKFGGHNGRPLRIGDILILRDNPIAPRASFPSEYRPKLANEWTIGVIPGPQPTDEYLKAEYLETLISSEYEVNFNSARTGIRLNGPIPQWVREDGGEAGLHPSNIHDNAYAVGALDLTGDQSILLGPDGPSLGGFVCPVTTAKAELWKIGQLRPGDKVRFQLITFDDAKAMRTAQERNIRGDYCEIFLPKPADIKADYAVAARGTAGGMDYIIRFNGEENILIEFGEMELNIELRFRVHTLMETLTKSNLPVIDMTPGIRSLQVHFDCNKIDALTVAAEVEKANGNLHDIDDITVPSRIIHLPLSWDDPQTKLAAKRYQQTVRPNAPWCPSNPEFIRRINGLESIDELKRIFFDASYLVLGLGDVYLGAPVATPVDPRHRLVTTKYNPARPWTPENAVGIGGAYLCVYGMEGPGGYQFVGRTIQMWNPLMETEHFTKGKPWLLNFFDQLRFYPCTADEILVYRDDFLRGRFELKIEESSFNLGEYKKYLNSIKESASAFKAHQEAAFQAERRRWAEQGLDQFVSEIKAAPRETATVPEGCTAVHAPIPGSVWKINVKAGQIVSKGETLVVLESMKMEFSITAPSDGTIRQIDVEEGQQVNAGQQVVCIK
jgi:urea carboxylase